MGASDWAGRMCERLEAEFGISEDRSIRFTTLVRLMRGEGYEDVFGPHGTEQHRMMNEKLIENLDESLKDQLGETVEQRWNSLMDELECGQHAEKGVYLIPWEEYNATDWHDPGVTDTRPE